jgi:hypothetical protein
MTLKEGKQYVTRSGLVTTPLSFDKNSGTNYRFEAMVKEPQHPTPSFMAWLRNGSYLTQTMEHELDLVEEFEPNK